jgi:hypothetical protein
MVPRMSGHARPAHALLTCRWDGVTMSKKLLLLGGTDGSGPRS